jgi:hypothetical protein
MDASVSATSDARVTLHLVDQSNWRAIANLKVFETQREFVAEPCSYLALCCYGQDWQPLAICLGDQVIGFMMWSRSGRWKLLARRDPDRPWHAETRVW